MKMSHFYLMFVLSLFFERRVLCIENKMDLPLPKIFSFSCKRAAKFTYRTWFHIELFFFIKKPEESNMSPSVSECRNLPSCWGDKIVNKMVRESVTLTICLMDQFYLPTI